MNRGELWVAVTSYLMLDKIFSFDKTDLAKRIGKLPSHMMLEVDNRLRLVLGL